LIIYIIPATAGSAELVEVLSKPVFATIGEDPSPRTFAGLCDGIGGLSSQSSPRLACSPCLTSPSSSNGGSAALSPAVFSRLSIASPWPAASSPAIFPPGPWVSSVTLGPPFEACGDFVETSIGCDLLVPIDCSTNHRHNSKAVMEHSASEESFDGNASGQTQYSQAVTSSNPATPVEFDSSSRSNFGCALVRSSSYGELTRLADETSAPSPVFFPARSMSAPTISSKLELHESSGAGGLSFLFYKRSRDGLEALSAQTLASMLRGGSNVDPPLLCSSSSEPCAMRAGASCPLSQQLSVHEPRFTVIDARYDFEFSGGHIERAKSINKLSDLAEFFFREHVRAQQEGTPIPPPPPPSEHVYVFHCEYSQKRGPLLLKVRKCCCFSNIFANTVLIAEIAGIG
jgi:hypothetical protein